MTEKLIKSCDQNYENFMNEVDSNLAKSRNIFSQLTNKLRQIDDEQWLELKNKVWVLWWKNGVASFPWVFMILPKLTGAE